LVEIPVMQFTVYFARELNSSSYVGQIFQLDNCIILYSNIYDLPADFVVYVLRIAMFFVADSFNLFKQFFLAEFTPKFCIVVAFLIIAFAAKKFDYLSRHGKDSEISNTKVNTHEG